MSSAIKCDGCGAVAGGHAALRDWLKASVRNGYGTEFAVGDFCAPDCLSLFLASDSLDKQIKKGAAA